MYQNHVIRVKNLVHDPIVTNAQAEELIMWSLDRLHKLSRRPRIAAETVDGSLEADTVWPR
jgi:hypothetical protein